MSVVTCLNCKINTFEKTTSRKYCDTCIPLVKSSKENERRRNKRLLSQTETICEHCNTNSFVKKGNIKYCDDCKPIVKKENKLRSRQKEQEQRKAQIKLCEHCNTKPCKSNGHKYCADCVSIVRKINNANAKEKAKVLTTKKCKDCDEEFTDTNSIRVYCFTCKPKRNDDEKGDEILTCESCGVNTFEKYKMRKYCDDCKVLKNRERCKDYKRNNKEKISEYNVTYKGEHKEETKEYNKNYNIENRESIQQRQNIQHKERRQTDPVYKFCETIRSRIRNCFKQGGKKILPSMELLGCSGKFLQDWLEHQFTIDMSLDNHGSYWHIDHVIPCAQFNILNETEQVECFHWTNLQPLKASENLSKNDSLRFREIHLHEIKLLSFLKQKNISDSMLYKNFNRLNIYKRIIHNC